MNYIITSTEKVMFWLMFVHLWSQPLVNFLKLDFEADPDKQTDPGIFFVTYL